MSLNPPVDNNNTPVLYRGEALLIRRNNIRLKAKIGSYSVQSDGILYVTSIRLCFIADCPKDEFSGLDIPLTLIINEHFNQPIFGCNNLSVDIIPGQDWGTATQFHTKLEFRKGGAQTFLRIFWKLMSGVHETRNIKVAEALPANIREIASGDFVRSAFIDPTDPTYIYTAQPYQPTSNLPQNYPVPAYYAQPVQVNLSPEQMQAIPVAQSAHQDIPVAQPAQPAQPAHTTSYPAAQPAQPAYTSYPAAQPAQPAHTSYPAAQPVYYQYPPQGYQQPSPYQRY